MREESTSISKYLKEIYKNIRKDKKKPTAVGDHIIALKINLDDHVMLYVFSKN